MEKPVTRTLYIDGELVMQLSQNDGERSDLERLEDLAARIQLHEQPQRRANVGYDAADALNGIGTVRAKFLKFKHKLLNALLKKLLLGHKTAMQNHVVCLYVERDIDTPAQTAANAT